MSVRVFDFEIKGNSPLLQHHDNLEWADQMTAWKKDPANAKQSVAGDDRTPAFRWIGALYHDNEHIAIPAENLSRALMEGAAMVPTGKGKKTFKAQSQSGMSVASAYLKLEVNGKHIPIDDIKKLIAEPDFGKHMEAVNEMGFSLFMRRARIGTSKHVRVRPRFNNWALSGQMQVWDDEITEGALSNFFLYAGAYKGLGDWRPGSPTPGAFGRFTAEVAKA